MKYKNLSFYFLILLLINGCSLKQKKQIEMVRNGKSDFKIVIPINADQEENRAAQFLQFHIHEITGCKIPIINEGKEAAPKQIFISKSEEVTYPDGFKIESQEQKISILGGAYKGCIYGVVDILETELGVRYYSPDFIVIPKNDDIILKPINRSDFTTNTYRVVNGEFTKNKDYKDFNRLNEISDVFADKYYVHTFHRLMPWQDYFETHPEYYAYMNGKRIIDQLCLSNPEVLQICIDKLKAEMSLQPDKKIWSVSQDDNFSYCQCKNCMEIIEEEESPSGPIIRFVNDIAQEFPDKIISTLAYQYSRKAPLKTKPRDNVQIMLCTIELNRSQPIAEDPRSTSFLKDLNDWGKISQHIYLWDYTIDFAHSVSPFPNLHVLQPNIQLFTENNVLEHFQQTNTKPGHEFSELKAYIISKLLWNPQADVKQVIQEFTDGYYGSGAPFIRKYIYHLQDEILRTKEWLDIYGPPTNYQNTFLSDENMQAYHSYFNQAEEVLKNEPDYLLHVKTARLPLQYSMMEIGKNDMFGSRGWYEKENDTYILKQRMLDELEKFYQSSKEANAKYLNESGLTYEEYYHATKRFIDIQIKGNLAFQKSVASDPLPSKKYSNGDLTYLTNGVRGANDYKVHWLGWEGQDFELVLDLEEVKDANTIEISTLWDKKSWILHPLSISCFVSKDGDNYQFIGKHTVEGDQFKESPNRNYLFETKGKKYRYVKFDVKGTMKLFDWHPSAGYTSWVFVDEIVVE